MVRRQASNELLGVLHQRSDTAIDADQLAEIEARRILDGHEPPETTPHGVVAEGQVAIEGRGIRPLAEQHCERLFGQRQHALSALAQAGLGSAPCGGRRRFGFTHGQR